MSGLAKHPALSMPYGRPITKQMQCCERHPLDGRSGRDGYPAPGHEATHRNIEVSEGAINPLLERLRRRQSRMVANLSAFRRVPPLHTGDAGLVPPHRNGPDLVSSYRAH